MKVKWDDKAPYRFLKYFGERHKRKKDCKGAMERLEFKEVSITKLSRDRAKGCDYKIYPKRLVHHTRKIKQGKSVGVFFCRQQDDGRWFIKDGNHRFLALLVLGIKKVRISYDPLNKV